MRRVASLVLDCYETLGTVMDPEQYYTLPNLRNIGVSIDDVEESLGFPRGWTEVSDASDEERLAALRRSVAFADVDWLFEKHVGRGRRLGEVQDEH